MPEFKWTNDLSVNVEKFDNDHKKLIDYLNKLYDAMSQGHGQKIVPNMLVSLIQYSKDHFKREEDVLQKHNYPHFEEHKKQHEEFVKKLNDLYEQYNSGSLALSIPMVNFLVSWIQNHIQRTDKKYSDFLAKLL